MSQVERLWVVIAVVAPGTFAIRASFLLFAGRVAALPATARDALRMVPAAALAAIVAPAVLRPAGAVDLTSPRAVTAVIALVVAWRTRSVLVTVLVGMVVVVLLDPVLG